MAITFLLYVSQTILCALAAFSFGNKTNGNGEYVLYLTLYIFNCKSKCKVVLTFVASYA